MEDLRRGRALYIGLVTLVVLGCVWLLWEMREVLGHLGAIIGSVLTPLLISVAIAYLLNPLVNHLHKRGVPRGASIVIIYFVFFLLLAGVLINTIPLFIDQLRDLGDQLPRLTVQAQQWLDGLHEDKKRLPLAVSNAIDSNLATLDAKMTAKIGSILQAAGNSLGALANLAVVPFVVFYLLKDVKGMERAVLVFFPKRNRQEITRLIRSINEALGSYVRGQLLVAVIVGILTYIGLLIVGMPYALLLAIIVALTNVIPYLGPFIGAAPALLLAFTVSPMMALKVLIVNVIIQQLEGNLISPLMIGRSLKLHPMLIIIAVVLGGEMFGMPGLILAIPVVAVGKVLLQHLVLHYMKR